MCPDINDLIVTFIVGNETHVVVAHNFIHLLLSFVNDFQFLIRSYNVSKIK